MRIGILTQPLLNNYGGLLQNYALQQVLIRLGHEVDTVDWMPASAGAIKTWLWRKKETLLSLVLKDREKPSYSLTDKEKEIISRNTHRFIERYISVCPSIAKIWIGVPAACLNRRSTTLNICLSTTAHPTARLRYCGRCWRIDAKMEGTRLKENTMPLIIGLEGGWRSGILE